MTQTNEPQEPQVLLSTLMEVAEHAHANNVPVDWRALCHLIYRASVNRVIALEERQKGLIDRLDKLEYSMNSSSEKEPEPTPT